MHLKRLVRPDLSHYSAHRPSDPPAWKRHSRREAPSGQQELVACTAGPVKSQPIQLEDAFEMGEAHLHLLALLPVDTQGFRDERHSSESTMMSAFLLGTPAARARSHAAPIVGMM